MKIDKIEWMIKIFWFSILIIWIYFSLTLIAIIWLWLILFCLVLFFNFVVFYPYLKLYYFKGRTKFGEWYTSKNKIDIKYKVFGGIVGYQPIEERHIAIIFPSDSRKNYPIIDKEETLLLFNYYRELKENYKIYFCFLIDDFKNIVKSDYIYGIHIFGHGRIDSLGLEDGIVVYRELKDTKPKEFVAQWHCNHGNKEETSLGYLIGKKYYVPSGKRRGFQNYKDIKKLINNQLKWTINKKFT
jgi:hypothetical protein